MTPAQRQMRAQVASHASWAQTVDRTARTAPARKAALDRFERQVDPEGLMDPATRAQMAESARRTYFRALAYKSSRARAARAGKKPTA
jgi:hypothetical protein